MFRLQRRLFATADMPNCQYFEGVGIGTVVNEVPNTAYQQTANAFDTRTFVRGSDARLSCQ